MPPLLSVDAILQRTARQLAEHEDTVALCAFAIPTLSGLLACGIEPAAADAATALNEVASAPGFSRPIRDAGAVPRLVRLLDEGPTSSAAVAAAGACASLAVDPTTQAAIMHAGCAKPLVTLLYHEAPDGHHGFAAAERAAAAVRNLAYRSQEHSETFVLHGAIHPLVRLISGEFAVEHPRTAEFAAGALANLSYAHPTNQIRICETRAIKPLVALLSMWHPQATAAFQTSRASRRGAEGPPALAAAAERALANLAGTNIHDVLAAVIGAAPPLERIPNLLELLRPVALDKLRQAAAGEDDFALRYAVAAASFLELTSDVQWAARLRTSLHDRRWRAGSWKPGHGADDTAARAEVEMRTRRMIEREEEERHRGDGAGPRPDAKTYEGYGATWL